MASSGFLLGAALLVSSLLAVNETAIAAPAKPSTDKKSQSIAACVPDSRAQQLWVDSVYNSLDTKGRVAQLFVPRLDISDNAAGRVQLKKMVDAGMGGFLLGKGTIADYAGLIRSAQADARIPLLVTLDGEWGLAMRVSDAPRFPYNMGLGAIDDENLLYDYGREVARECRALGINVDFSPVLDVNSNPANPVIGYRSFGDDPKRVARLGVAYSQGMESGGVLSVAKHFPGHGDTNTDSHKALPTIDHDRKTLDAIDLLPFREYINAGLGGVMVGHLNVPALDKSGTPASLSSKISTELLRDHLGFKGLVFTDALAMKGASITGENNCVSAIRAGADVVLQPLNPSSDLNAVIAAVEDGRIPESMLEDRCKRVLAFKYALGLNQKPEIASTEEIVKTINSYQAQEVNSRLAAASITCLDNSADLLPIRNFREKTIAVVSLGAKADNKFSEYCRKYADVEVYGTPEGVLTSAQLSAIKNHDIVIVGVFSDGKGAQTSFAQLDGVKDLVPVFFINPYKMAKFSSSIKRHATLITAYDDTPFLREYAAQAVFGGITVNGRFPVNINGLFNSGDGVSIYKSRLGYGSPETVGMKPDLEARIDSKVNSSLKAGAFPGCQVAIVKDGNIVFSKAYGVTTKADGGVPVTTETLYDIASMTKATATLSGVMKAIDEGYMSLDSKVADFVTDLEDTDKGALSVRQLLTHETGFQPTLNMFKLMMDTASYSGPLTNKTRTDLYSIKIEDGLYGNSQAKLRTDILSTKRNGKFDMQIGTNLYAGVSTFDTIMDKIYHGISLNGSKKYRYSCLNFCILMDLEERATGVAHDQWVDLEIFEPIGAYNTCFFPGETISLDRIAPTEADNFLRRQTMHGFVHDEIACFSGGVSGNAGLFSTAEDIAKFSQMLLNKGSYGNEQIIGKETIESFLKFKSPTCNRGLAFDIKKAPDGKSDLLGHTGFTGTCFWIDPSRQIVFVFLSNRVNPSRDNAAFRKSNIRNALLEEIYNSL